jgi:hypothetical protein
VHAVTVLRLLLALASTYRLTRLVTSDAVWDGTRDRITRWTDRPRRKGEPKTRFTLRQKLGEWIVCPHCVGIYVAVGVTVAAYHVPGIWFDGPAIALACAAVTSLIADVTEARE